MLLTSAVPPVAADSDMMPPRPAQRPMVPAPVLEPEEEARRRTTPSTEVQEEAWYQRGKQSFVAKCAGCHPAGTNVVKMSKGLTWKDLKKNGVDSPESIRKIIRYGKGTMPGYAADCIDKNDGDVLQCGVLMTLDEDVLQDIENFVINRANSNWKGRG